MAFAVFLTFRLYRPFSAKTFLSEIPSPRSLQPLFLANITISPKTDLSEYLSQLRVVFPANLLSKLYFLSLSRCFPLLIFFVLLSALSSDLCSPSFLFSYPFTLSFLCFIVKEPLSFRLQGPSHRSGLCLPLFFSDLLVCLFLVSFSRPLLSLLSDSPLSNLSNRFCST